MKVCPVLTDPIGVGCYVDGHWGWRAIPQMLAIFDGVAYTLSKRDRFVISRYVDTHGALRSEEVTTMADRAEEALNTALAGTGTIAHWHDGEFFVSPCCGNDEPCADEHCYCQC
jgi:hypothetical protein